MQLLQNLKVVLSGFAVRGFAWRQVRYRRLQGRFTLRSQRRASDIKVHTALPPSKCLMSLLRCWVVAVLSCKLLAASSKTAGTALKTGGRTSVKVLHG